MYLEKVNHANPLKYFEDLSQGLLRDYYDEFKSQPNYSYETDLDYVITADSITGEAWEFYETFEDYIEYYLKYNSRKIIDFIYLRLQGLKEAVSIKAYLGKVLNDIDKITISLNEFKNRGTQLVLDYLKKIRSEITETIEIYLYIGNKPTQNKIEYLLARKSQIVAYIWKGQPANAQLYLLHHKLTRYHMIDEEVSFETFRMAFSGVILEKPLMIRWKVLSKNGRHTNKSALFYLISSLIDMKLIDNNLAPHIDDNELKRISMIFCDHEGNLFRNLKQSKYYSLENSDSKPLKGDIIDKIIGELYVSSKNPTNSIV